MMLFTIRQRLLIFAITAGIAGSFALVGYFIGRALGNAGAGAIVAAVASFPLSQVVLVRQMKKEGERIAKSYE